MKERDYSSLRASFEIMPIDSANIASLSLHLSLSLSLLLYQLPCQLSEELAMKNRQDQGSLYCQYSDNNDLMDGFRQNHGCYTICSLYLHFFHSHSFSHSPYRALSLTLSLSLLDVSYRKKQYTILYSTSLYYMYHGHTQTKSKRKVFQILFQVFFNPPPP